MKNILVIFLLFVGLVLFGFNYLSTVNRIRTLEAQVDTGVLDHRINRIEIILSSVERRAEVFSDLKASVQNYNSMKEIIRAIPEQIYAIAISKENITLGPVYSDALTDAKILCIGCESGVLIQPLTGTVSLSGGTINMTDSPADAAGFLFKEAE